MLTAPEEATGEAEDVKIADEDGLLMNDAETTDAEREVTLAVGVKPEVAEIEGDGQANGVTTLA